MNTSLSPEDVIEGDILCLHDTNIFKQEDREEIA